MPHGKIQVPTLLVNGDHDLSTPLPWARQELAKAPQGKLVVVPGAGHFTYVENPEAFRAALVGFLL